MTERCPNCDSKSGVDTKGREFCHACHKDFGFSEIGKRIDKTLNKITKQLIKVGSTLPLPKPNDKSLTIEAITYLDKYFELGNIPYIDIFWSDKYDRLCFPYYIDKLDGRSMIGCWMRDITNTQPAKWLYAGKDQNSYVWIYTTHALCANPNNDMNCVECKYNYRRVCIVEDVISAKRCSKYMDTICLGGTSFSSEALLKELLGYKSILIFLDGDSAGRIAANKFRNQYKLLRDVRILRNKKDPKCYSNQQLEKFLK